VKMKLAVLRQNGAGCSASVATAPLSDINANRIVHPSMFTLPLESPPFVFASSDDFCATAGSTAKRVFACLMGKRSARPKESRCQEARDTSSRILVCKFVREP
jgi:hypothetical protein